MSGNELWAENKYIRNFTLRWFTIIHINNWYLNKILLVIKRSVFKYTIRNVYSTYVEYIFKI